ncbi:uncharacterized protein LOC132707687 [Cylas formicarius]|uniref:uncharacterized protein LOC132707687 n=1 Tax=Cylas formicarius TaxID=197179 RepID=UPI00295894A1|nr:uncharacterized protein LOC132707687 [Cylas formicarius]
MDAENLTLFLKAFCVFGILQISDGETQIERTGRFWPGWPIGVIRFANNVCTSLEGFSGTCLTRRQCAGITGTGSGTCVSNGIGVCCLVQRTCGDISSYNNTYFTSTNFPNTFNGDTQCVYTIQPCVGSCQVRLDFLSFILAQPDGNGFCVTDSMVITGSASNVPILCGENSGQHIYLNFNGNDSIIISITTSATADLERIWSFKATQLACDCPTLAPTGCLQYYDTSFLTGTVRSFNYGTSINGALVNYNNGTSVPGTRQIANTNYGICIAMAPGYCSIQWAQSADSTSFTLTENTALVEVLFGLPASFILGDNCTTDFVVVPNPIFPNGTAVNTDRFCGNQFPTVISASKPFVLTAVTNGDELSDVANRGFALTFTQQACRNVNPLVVVLIAFISPYAVIGTPAMNLIRLSLFVSASICLPFGTSSEQNALETSAQALERDGKQFFFFPFFGVGLVRFLNGECNSGNTFDGTCYTRRQCEFLDGVGSVTCANGAGICCLFQRNCGESSGVNNTYFVSPGFPSTYAGSSTCTFTILNTDGACQARIDFLTLQLAQPNENGTCVTDALVITGGASIVPVICGENSGQHVYVDFFGNSSITVSVITGPSVVGRAWNLKVALINCNCPWKAPTGCLQYYTATSGTVRSFNYGSTGITNGTRQLANLNYGVCIQMQPGYCSIQWSQTSDIYSFTVSNDTFTAVVDGTIGAASSQTGTNCTTDFVIVPAPIFPNGTLFNTDRFCGNGFVTLSSNSKPFVLTVVTNSNEVNDTGNRGFALSYAQQPCIGTILTG